MQDLLKKIIEMDAQARKIEQKAKAEKQKSEQEIEALREEIYNKYIERAKERVEKNIAVDQAHADERLAAYQTTADALKSAMLERRDQHMDEWVDELVRRALS